MIKTARNIPFAICLFLLLFAGCKSFDGRAVREKHAKDYQRDLATETNDVLSKKTAFDLNDCIQTALENNLQIRASKIQQQIAKLERKIAFAAFLPAVNLDYRIHKMGQTAESQNSHNHNGYARPDSKGNHVAISDVDI